MLIEQIASLIFLAPLAALISLTLIGATNFKSSEILVKRTVAISQTISFFASVYVLFSMIFASSDLALPIKVFHRNIFSSGEHSIQFSLSIDRLSIWFVIMATTLSNIVGVFSQNYLHHDAGFYRFFFLITLFLNGILILFMGSTFSVIFVGWELIGITSALLISFFNARRETIDNALHAFWSYRITDMGLLTASAVLAAHLHEYSFSAPASPHHLSGTIAYALPLLLLLSAMGKSAQYPFCSWLPKAMEGPTSSSAIFYGGLSVHAGVYLLLRFWVEFDIPLSVRILIALVGLLSALYGALLSQVQSDVKSALGYASISQVGIMFIELSAGWYHLVVVHCLGHAFLRTYQILKSASIIQEFLDFEDAHQNNIATPSTSVLALIVSKDRQNKLFSLAFNLALNDAFGPSKIVVHIEKFSRFLEGLEDAWLEKLISFRRPR